MKDKRSGKIVLVAHCLLNVHSLEDNLAIYPGLEEEVIKLLIEKGVSLYQILCPEIELSGIFRKALPKESYDHPKIRKIYRQLADKIADNLRWYAKKDYKIIAVIGAEASPSCGVELVGRWKVKAKSKREFPRDIEFIPGMGVFMEELKSSLAKINIYPEWIGIPGKSIRTLKPESLEETLNKLDKLL